MKFEIISLPRDSVWALYRMRNRIQLDPEYQRLGDIWTEDKRQFLVDTVLNDFDIPKIYLHKFRESLKKDGQVYDYAIIDGKQRLETLWNFVDGDFALASDFEYFDDPSIKASGMKYSELGREYPDLKVQFDNFKLAVVCIETNEIEIIEEMFSRLNEAAPLTAPEKRNAFGGPLPKVIRTLSKEPFFTKALPFPNKRYRHFDLAAKFLLAESAGKIVDTKKVYLDEFALSFKESGKTVPPRLLKRAKANVDRMVRVFTKADPLLRGVGMVTLYYHLFRVANDQGWNDEITRQKLVEFDEQRAENRKKAEKNIAKADYDLLEFDRFAQAPNDGYALRFRLQILLQRVFKKKMDISDA
jgi:uncharacterized protein DUF262